MQIVHQCQFICRRTAIGMKIIAILSKRAVGNYEFTAICGPPSTPAFFSPCSDNSFTGRLSRHSSFFLLSSGCIITWRKRKKRLCWISLGENMRYICNMFPCFSPRLQTGEKHYPGVTGLPDYTMFLEVMKRLKIYV